ncbi:MAG: thiamine phosphate synthase [Gemmatimonadetes bacterium]|nr:thiamine phosphate synthase [Gemmatimonadota bacterium]
MTSPLGGDSGFPVLHVITDDVVIARPGFVDEARAVLARGGTRVALHLRAPRAHGGTLERLARALTPGDGHLVVNDRLDVGLAVGAAGVQLAERSLPLGRAREVAGDLPLGRSVHGVVDLEVEPAADWYVVGTVWASTSHPDRPGAGTELVEAVAAATPAPIVAIGGLTPARVGAARAAGAAAVAVLSGIWSARDPAAAAVGYLSAWSEA